MYREEQENIEAILNVEHRLGNMVGRNGYLSASKRAPEHYLPEIGDIILYNMNNSQIEAGRGSFGKTPRGIGRVIGYGGCGNSQMWVMVYRRPGLNYRESFLVQDFLVGIYVYRKLVDYVYTTDRYSYYDLDITEPHEDIAKLFADNGDNIIRDEQQIYAKVVL